MEQYELLKCQQSRVCVDHNNKPISMGCRKCLKMSCTGCVSSMGTCSEGESHQLMSLEELVLLLNDEINKLKNGMIEKEESLEQIFKFTSQTLAEYDLETAQSVEKIHKKRDEQMELLSLKYKEFEEDFQEARLKNKTCITDFLEDKILVKWTQLRNLTHKVDSRAQHAHQCDIVSSYSDTKNTIQQLVDEALPSIDIASLSKVKDKCGSCEIMLEVVSTDGFLIDKQLKLRPSKPLPKSLKLLHTLSLPSYPFSTRVWNSQILTGMDNKAVATIDNNYQVKGSFITFNNYPRAMEVYKDRLYTAVYGSNKVVVSDHGSSQVCLIDISHGQLLWTCKDVPHPQGVACYGEKYVLVAAYNSSTVRILDSSTGEVVSELTDSTIESGCVYDMDISGDRLIVANHLSKNIAVFQLQP
ncbi:uncharacterized protein [Watersipora subatra]|uniref:uncharacterized protein n=1 Tax=Watersipora subatra TaxID=2589382 RepID=UPI00355B09F1